MKCPNCNVNLVMTDRSGVEIDYCPECRGVWLDRGELDKIIDRSHKPYPANLSRQNPAKAKIISVIKNTIIKKRNAILF